MTPCHCIAIDPGKSGGLALWSPDAGARAMKIPEIPDIRSLVITEYKRAKAAGLKLSICIEEPPRYYARAPGHEAPLSRISLLFENYGMLRGLMYGIGVSSYTIRPQDWQKLFAKRDKMPYSNWKRLLKDIAQREFPDLGVTLHTADALLMLSHMLRAKGIKNPRPVSQPGAPMSQAILV